MKWYQTIILACGLALMAPQISMAKPDNSEQGENGKADKAKKDKADKEKKDKANKDKADKADKDKKDKADKADKDKADKADKDKKDKADKEHGNHGKNGKDNESDNSEAEEGSEEIEMAVMDEKKFSELLNSVSKSALGANKVARIRAAAKKNYFSCDQVRQLMKAVKLDNNKITVAVELNKRVLDKDNWDVVYSALTFSTSKLEIDRRLGISE